jgi:archaellin
MAINKVVYGNQTLMDLTADTVTASDVASGVTFHNAAGEAVVGTASGSSNNWVDIIGTLTAGNTSITLSNPSIKLTSTFNFYTDVFGVCPTNVSVSNGSITLIFDARLTDLEVKVRVTNENQSSNYSHIMWQLLKTRGNPPHAGAIQVSEFFIMTNGSDYSWGSSTITSNMAGASSQEVSKLIDGDIFTKYCTTQWGSVQTNQCDIVIALDGSISSSDITGYAFVTGEDESSRDPISWKLYGSSNGTDWTLIDEQTDYAVATERRTRVNITI